MAPWKKLRTSTQADTIVVFIVGVRGAEEVGHCLSAVLPLRLYTELRILR
jgi:hypothetical protein